MKEDDELLELEDEMEAEDPTETETEANKKDPFDHALDAFGKAIKAYLDDFAAQNPFFQVKYNGDNQSINKCCSYIIDTVRKSNKNACADDEVYKMARDYFEEGKKVDKVSNARVVVPKKKEEPKQEQLSLFDMGF